MIKWSIHQEGVTIKYIYTQYQGTQIYKTNIDRNEGINRQHYHCSIMKEHPDNDQLKKNRGLEQLCRPDGLNRYTEHSNQQQQ